MLLIIPSFVFMYFIAFIALKQVHMCKVSNSKNLVKLTRRVTRRACPQTRHVTQQDHELCVPNLGRAT